MKNILWITIAISFAFQLSSTPVEAGWPSVDFPSDAGITLQKGNTYNLLWSSVNTDPVDIKLCNEIEPSYIDCFYDIARNVPNNGQYSWTVPTSLPNGSNYVISVGKVPVSAASSDFPFTISDQIQTPLLPPRLSLSTSGLSVFTSWTSVPGATGYTLYYAPYPYEGAHTINSIDMGFSTSFAATLWDGAAYYVAVTAGNNGGESEYSNIELVAIDSSNTDRDGDGTNYDIGNTDGVLDLSFGSGGVITTDVGGFDDSANSVAIQLDGKILVGGARNYGNNNDFALLRYNSDGSLDTTFNSTGIVTTDIGNGVIRSVAIQLDGKILAAGNSYITTGNNSDFVLIRYNSNGSLDTTFHANGIFSMDVDSGYEMFNSVVVQPDEKILVGGISSHDMALFRFNTDGSFDTTFGASGIVTTDLGGYYEHIYSLKILPDGKILAAGHSWSLGDYYVALVRYNSDGSLDTSFNSTGSVITDVGGSDDFVNSLEVQPDGKILLGGSSHNGSYKDLALLRYNSDGSLDTTFNSSGIVTTDVGGSGIGIVSIANQLDGKILAAGTINNGSNNDFALFRYNSDGSLDTTFNSTGIVTMDVYGSEDDAGDMAILSDADILLIGSSIIDNNQKDIVLLRYLGTL